MKLIKTNGLPKKLCKIYDKMSKKYIVILIYYRLSSNWFNLFITHDSLSRARASISTIFLRLIIIATRMFPLFYKMQRLYIIILLDKSYQNSI